MMATKGINAVDVTVTVASIMIINLGTDFARAALHSRARRTRAVRSGVRYQREKRRGNRGKNRLSWSQHSRH